MVDSGRIAGEITGSAIPYIVGAGRPWKERNGYTVTGYNGRRLYGLHYGVTAWHYVVEPTVAAQRNATNNDA